jgi:hypothetical protein
MARALPRVSAPPFPLPTYSDGMEPAGNKRARSAHGEKDGMAHAAALLRVRGMDGGQPSHREAESGDRGARIGARA